MIVVTGALGFIGSCIVSDLVKRIPLDELVLVDDWSKNYKYINLDLQKKYTKVDRSDLDQWLLQHRDSVHLIIHMGARTDTTETDRALFDKLNFEYSKMVWRHCVKADIRLIYASSAATYGLGEHGYIDDHDVVNRLQPLNEYGWSKQWFDQWALKQKDHPPLWVGLKFFNVYGPNEYHKGRMASVIFHTFQQVKQSGAMRLFKSHRSDIKDGDQSRDFVYVKDLVKVVRFFSFSLDVPSGLYNLGTGLARTFYDLARATFVAMGVSEQISFIETPIDIRDKYQYFTEANITKLRSVGYADRFYTLEEGVADYTNYLKNKNCLI